MTNVQLPDGTTAKATKVDFDHGSEPWGEYELEDGTTLKVRTVVQSITRIAAEDHQEGNEPLYNVQSNTLVRAVDIPDELIETESEPVERGVQ